MIGTQLGKLKQKRTDADYKLWLVMSDSKCKDCIKWAQKIIDSDLEYITDQLILEATKTAKASRWI